MTDRQTAHQTAQLALKQAAQVAQLLPETHLILEMRRHWDDLAGPAVDTLAAAPAIVRDSILGTLAEALLDAYQPEVQPRPAAIEFWKAVLVNLLHDQTQGGQIAPALVAETVTLTAVEAIPAGEPVRVMTGPLEGELTLKGTAARIATEPKSRRVIEPRLKDIDTLRDTYTAIIDLVRRLYALKIKAGDISTRLAAYDLRIKPNKISGFSTDYSLKQLDLRKVPMGQIKATELLSGLQLVAEEVGIIKHEAPAQPEVPATVTEQPQEPQQQAVAAAVLATAAAAPQRVRNSAPAHTTKDRRAFIIGLRRTATSPDYTFRAGDLMKPFGMHKIGSVSDFLFQQNDLVTHIDAGMWKFTQYKDSDHYPKN